MYEPKTHCDVNVFIYRPDFSMVGAHFNLGGGSTMYFMGSPEEALKNMTALRDLLSKEIARRVLSTSFSELEAANASAD